MTKYEEYLICQKRGHKPTGYADICDNSLGVCRLCGTRYRYDEVLIEKNVPERPVYNMSDPIIAEINRAVERFRIRKQQLRKQQEWSDEIEQIREKYSDMPGGVVKFDSRSFTYFCRAVKAIHTLLKHIDKLKLEVKAANVVTVECAREIDNVKIERDGLHDEIADYRNEIDRLKEELRPYKDNEKFFGTRMNYLDYMKKYFEKEGRNNKHKEEIQRIRDKYWEAHIETPIIANEAAAAEYIFDILALLRTIDQMRGEGEEWERLTKEMNLAWNPIPCRYCGLSMPKNSNRCCKCGAKLEDDKDPNTNSQKS